MSFSASSQELDIPQMPSKISPCVVGIDVGGTNTDAVLLRDDKVLAWHKTPTTADIQQGVEVAIEEVIRKADIQKHHVGSVKIGTTQFVNAVLEQDSSKLDKVAIVRLCGPHSHGSPPFVDFPPALRNLVEGHFGYVDGGYQVDGTPILPLNTKQLQEQAQIVKSKSLKSIVVIGIYSPSNPEQELQAREILLSELGPGYDVSCSHAVGRLGFLERENASIINASLRRFARHVMARFSYAVRQLGKCNLYIALNDGTLSKAKIAAEHPVRCISSGPTNSARGAAFLAKSHSVGGDDEREVLVVDVGGTTTDICALLKTGYPRQSAAFVKIGGVRTNFTIPDVHSIALGGGSQIREKKSRTLVGPDSVGSKLEIESIAFGGTILTATDLVLMNEHTEKSVSQDIRISGLEEIARAVEEAIDLVKTKKGDAKLILVGGGSIIIADRIAGVSEILRPKYFEVANAVGAAIGKISGVVDKTVVPQDSTIEEEIEKAKGLATERCVSAGGNVNTIEVVEVEAIPQSYVTNGATNIRVRVVGDLKEGYEELYDSSEDFTFDEPFGKELGDATALEPSFAVSKGSSYEIDQKVDVRTYRPRIEGDVWYLSETDLMFLQDGTGILGVGSCGEPYPAYLACLVALRNGEDITIRRQDTLPDDAVVLVAGFMGSPSVYLERIPGLNEVTDAIKGVLKITGITTFDSVIPNEIGGMNSFEALLAAHRFGKSTLDTDLVGRAYPMLWQTVRCLKDVPVVPACLADSASEAKVFAIAKDNLEAETLMRDACSELGSLAGMCVSPVYGAEAKTLPKNSFSHAWQIGRSIALSRALKRDPISSLLESQNGVLLFVGKIVSVTRIVGEGFTRGNVVLESFAEGAATMAKRTVKIEFENENLSVVLKGQMRGEGDEVLACCPDLITILDKANGAPLGISDYKYGLRVSVIALRAPPVWTSERGLEMGGPRTFGLDIDYKPVVASGVVYTPPKSVWELFSQAG